MPRRTRPLQARGEEWDKARMRALVRDDFTCQAARLDLPMCTETRLRHLQVHHIQQRQYGGTHDIDNLLTVCATCHSRIHPWMVWELPQRPHEAAMGDDEKRWLEMPVREL